MDLSIDQRTINFAVFIMAPAGCSMRSLKWNKYRKNPKDLSRKGGKIQKKQEKKEKVLFFLPSLPKVFLSFE